MAESQDIIKAVMLVIIAVSMVIFGISYMMFVTAQLSYNQLLVITTVIGINSAIQLLKMLP